MALITIQVLEGLERGRVFEAVETPVTIGREDDNTIQLNDERVSRFHAKIQEDGHRVLLTDLDSTNGTRVNGRPVQLRVLSPGDQVTIGRCLLVFGSREEIEEHLGPDPVRGRMETTPAVGITVDATVNLVPAGDDDFDLLELFPGGPPEIPSQLSPLQQAQLSDLISYVHDRIGSVLNAAASQREADTMASDAGESKTAAADPNATPADDRQIPGEPMVVNPATWQAILQLEMDLAVYLKTISEPSEVPDGTA